MSIPTQIQEIVRAAQALPAEKVAELHDFANYLKDRYAKPSVEYSDWSEEDLRAVSDFSLRYAEETMPWTEPATGEREASIRQP